MAGRQGPPAMMDDPRLLRRPSAMMLEERLAAQEREIQVLLRDNQRLGATHVALKQELAAAEQELRQLDAAGRVMREERELEVRQVYDRSMRMEAEVRAVDAMGAELGQVRADVRRLTEGKIELTAELKALEAELDRSMLEAREVPAIRADLDAMRQELLKGRAAIEFEKKTRTANLEQSRAMDRNMVLMQREIDKLHAELANAEKRARASAAAAVNPTPGYMGNYGSPNIAFAGGGSYPIQYPMLQAQTKVDGASPVPFGYGPIDMQQTNVPKG